MNAEGKGRPGHQACVPEAPSGKAYARVSSTTNGLSVVLLFLGVRGDRHQLRPSDSIQNLKVRSWLENRTCIDSAIRTSSELPAKPSRYCDQSPRIMSPLVP